MWYIIILMSSITFVSLVSYFLGYWSGKRDCMVEHKILFGKDTENFEKKAREAEEKMGLKL